jgi:transposase InsO family protein
MFSCANAPKRRDVRGRETDGCKRVDRTLEAMGLRILKTPVRAPQANAFCERVIGTIRRECLDFIIPMSEYGTFARFFESGSVTTTVAGHTRAWDLAFRRVPSLLRSSVSQTAARFRRVAESRRRQS